MQNSPDWRSFIANSHFFECFYRSATVPDISNITVSLCDVTNDNDTPLMLQKCIWVNKNKSGGCKQRAQYDTFWRSTTMCDKKFDDAWSRTDVFEEIHHANQLLATPHATKKPSEMRILPFLIIHIVWRKSKRTTAPASRTPRLGLRCLTLTRTPSQPPGHLTRAWKMCWQRHTNGSPAWKSAELRVRKGN